MRTKRTNSGATPKSAGKKPASLRGTGSAMRAALDQALQRLGDPRPDYRQARDRMIKAQQHERRAT